LEQPQLSELWGKDFGNYGQVPHQAAPPLEILICPSDSPETEGVPHLAYVANAGQMFSDTTRGQEGPGGVKSELNTEYPANGVFLDLSRNTHLIPSGASDGRENKPEPKMTSGQIRDGLSGTMLFSESLHKVYWTYPSL